MPKNPLVNALGASAYIAVIVALINFASQNLRNKPDTAFAPMAMISLLTLSVSVMAFLFFYQPLQLFLAGKKNEAVKFFLLTVGIFGAITLVVSFLVFSGVL